MKPIFSTETVYEKDNSFLYNVKLFDRQVLQVCDAPFEHKHISLQAKQNKIGSDECLFNSKLTTKADDNGFMGSTHALSAVAFYLLILLFAKSYLVASLGQQAGFWVLLSAGIVIIGASLIPDLDNTNSTAKSTLGALGYLLRTVMRASSRIVQGTFRTKYDPRPDAVNPHRGFWHTLISWLIVGFLMMGLFSINKPIKTYLIGQTTWGGIFAFIAFVICINLSANGLLKNYVKRLKNRFGVFRELSIWVVSIALAIVLLHFIPVNQGYQWIAVAFVIGCWFHEIGDCFTKMGAPLLAPIIKIKGKRWYFIRFAGTLITTGENESGEKIMRGIFWATIIICGTILLYNNFQDLGAIFGGK